MKMNTEKAKQALNSIIARLKSLYMDDVLDDGCDSHDEEQNRNYVCINREINSINEELAGYDFEEMSSEECDRIWKDSWNGYTDVHLPEVKYNHAIEYANRLLTLLNK